MGRNFKAPKKRDIAQWQKVAALYSAGVAFWGYNVADPPPGRLREVAEYVAALKVSREG